MEVDYHQDEMCSTAEFDVLYTLYSAKREMTLCEIAANITLSRSGLSRLLDRLEADGSISKRKGEVDRRELYIGLQPKGEAAMDRYWESYSLGISRYFGANLTDHELTVITNGMRRIAQDLIRLKEERTGESYIHEV